MISKTINELRTDLVDGLLTRIPNIDITDGTPERDMFIEAPISGQLITLWDKLIYTAKLFAPLTYYNDLSEDDINLYLANYNVTPLAATYSTGVVTYYTYNMPTRDIIINSGSIAKTDSSTPVEFAVQGDYVIYASISSYYYNVTLGRYEIDCSVKAVNSGSSYRAGINTVTVTGTSIPGIEGCINAASITGGSEPETIQSALRRTVEKFQGRGLASTQGLKSYVQSYTSTVNVVTAEDPEMTRDLEMGGAVDIYVKGETITTVTDTVTITGIGLANPLSVDYTNSSIKMLYQPAIRLVSVAKNSTILSPTFYTLTKDTSIMIKESTRSLDKMTLTSTGISSTGYFVDGDVIEITYTYNSLLTTISDDLNSTSNYYMNRDYLLRSMTPVTINTAFTFKETAGQNFTNVSADVQLSIASFIDAILNNGSVERADIVGVAKQNVYVDNIYLPSVVLTPIGGGTVTSAGDILLGKNEYPQSGNIILTRWA